MALAHTQQPEPGNHWNHLKGREHFPETHPPNRAIERCFVNDNDAPSLKAITTHLHTIALHDVVQGSQPKASP